MFTGEFMSETTMMRGMLDLAMSPEEMPANGLMNVVESFFDVKGTMDFEFNVFVSSDPCPDSGDKTCEMGHPFVLIGLSTRKDPGAFMVMGTIGLDDMGNYVAMGEYEYKPRGIMDSEIVDMGTFEISAMAEVIEPPK
jgi:hypothetical protein